MSASPTALPARTSGAGSRACRRTGRSGPPRRRPGPRPRRRRPARSRTRTGSTSAPSSPKWATPIAAQRCEDVLAVRDTRRSAGSRRAAAVGRSRPAARVELGHRGEEFTGADERHGSGHGQSLAVAPRYRRGAPDRRALRHWPAHDHPPAMDPRRDDHRVRRRLPRRDHRQRRPQAASAQELPATRSSPSSRARPTSSAATSRSSPPC